MGIVIVIFVVAFIIALGKYAIKIGQDNPYNNKWKDN